ncbi:G-protein coupled receptor Mth2 [Gryllus bimaculatus]|nr:G-protein coupled receptor Mth2 [Gryllus bimaculatus]
MRRILICAFFGQFFLLAAFFWLTVLCFDFTRGFMDLLPINDARSAGRRLLYYSLFAWSGPTIIVTITVALNYSPGLPDWLQKPEIGLYSCWFSPTWAKFFYHYGPVACLLLANIFMFSYTMFRLRSAQRSGRGMLKNEDSCLTGGYLRKRRERYINSRYDVAVREAIRADGCDVVAGGGGVGGGCRRHHHGFSRCR